MTTILLGNPNPARQVNKLVPDGLDDVGLRALAAEWGVPTRYPAPSGGDGATAWTDRTERELRSLLNDHHATEAATDVGATVTRFSAEDTIPLEDLMFGLFKGFDGTVNNGIVSCAWSKHAVAPPSWVWSDDPAVAQSIARRFGCPIGVPADVERTHWTNAGPAGVEHWNAGLPLVHKLLPASLRADVDPGTTPEAASPPSKPKGAGGGTSAGLAVLWALILFALTRHALRTSAGIDHQSRVSYDTASNGSASYAPLIFFAVTEDTADTPTAGDTTLAGELTGEGFARTSTGVVYGHTNGTTTTTLTKTFTMTSGTSRQLQQAGLFNAATTGTMGYKTLVPSPPTLVPADSVAFTWTFSLA